MTVTDQRSLDCSKYVQNVYDKMPDVFKITESNKTTQFSEAGFKYWSAINPNGNIQLNGDSNIGKNGVSIGIAQTDMSNNDDGKALTLGLIRFLVAYGYADQKVATELFVK